ncbi:tyrosine-type recombinase/integrase [Pseudooceanicola sp. MF1-13]|uniref:tyrosine-type recombinase/integrase n=1 Tax=Pseudooceanicola sp. MF1-13 TaxID=3379095 RepID=UPI003891C6AF
MSKTGERSRSGLTQKFVDRAEVGRHNDGGGLYLNVKSEGQGSWEWRGQRNGKRREIGLGSAKTVKLAVARDLAAKIRTAILEQRDPLEAIGRVKGAGAKDWTLNAVVERTFESLKPSLKGEGNAGRWMSPLQHHVLPKMGKMSVEEITSEDIRATLSPIWTTKQSTAKKAFNRLKMSLDYAADEGARVDEAAAPRAKRLLGQVPNNTKHIPHTPYEDIPQLYERICELDQTPATLALRLALLTVHRGSPVREAMVEQFDIENRVWTIPAQALKGRLGTVSDVRCPLSPEAAKVVELAMRHARGGKLFPAQYGPNEVPQKSVLEVLNNLGEKGRIHGFRSSFSDWATATGIPPDMSERCIQHKVGNKVSQAYQRDDHLPLRRKIMNDWSSYVTSAKEGTQRAGLRVVE